jgi:Sec-independent protein translocase protein TatA
LYYGIELRRNAADCLGNRCFIWPDKLPEIARGLGEGVRKMKGAVEDIKTEIMKEADNPVSEIKKEIEKVKQSAQNSILWRKKIRRKHLHSKPQKSIFPRTILTKVLLADNL